MLSTLFQEAQDAFSAREYQRAYDLYNQAALEDPSNIRPEYLKYVAKFHADPIEGFGKLDQLSDLTDEYMKLFMTDSNSEHTKSVLVNEILFYSASLIVHLSETAGDSFNNQEIPGDTLITLLYLLSRYADGRYSAVIHEQNALDIGNGIHMLCEAEKIVLKTVSNARACGVEVSADDAKFFAEISTKFGGESSSRGASLNSIARASRPSPETMIPSTNTSTSDFVEMFLAYKTKIEDYTKRPLRHVDDLEDLHTDIQELISVSEDSGNVSFKDRSDIFQEIIAGYNLLILKMLTLAEKRYCDRDGRVDDDKVLVLRNVMLKIAHNSTAVIVDVFPLLQKYPRIKDSLDHLCNDTDSVILIGYRDITTVSGDYQPTPLDFRNLMIKISRLLSSVWKEINPSACISPELSQAVEKDVSDYFPEDDSPKEDESKNKWQEIYDKNEKEREESLKRLASYRDDPFDHLRYL